jgi:hypothetical protein
VGRGFLWELKTTPWLVLLERYDDLARQSGDFVHMGEIVRSVMTSTAVDHLAATTSMHDLLVVDTPIAPPHLEYVIVRAPSSMRPPAHGHVAIEHVSLTGHDESIERPVDEAVALFWRFMAEKFGVISG